MLRTIGRLTALAVSRAKTAGRYPDGGGLYLLVSESGARSWVYRYMLQGRSREMGLGPLRAFGLAEARAKAAECRKARWDGADPIEVRKGQRTKEKLDAAKSISFKDAVAAYVAIHKAGWRNEKYSRQWKSALERHVYPAFGTVPVQSVDVTLVVSVLEPI